MGEGKQKKVYIQQGHPKAEEWNDGNIVVVSVDDGRLRNYLASVSLII